MNFIQTVESNFSAQHFLIYLLLVHSFSLNLVNSETLQDLCRSRCKCEGSDGSGITSVTCNGLELRELPTMRSSENVTSFDVSNNILTHIKEFVFKDCRSLKKLCLSENKIKRIDSKAFYGLEMLIDIDLSNNMLEFITPDMFSVTPVLEKVSFRDNPLVYVPDSSPILVSLNLTSLDLSSCILTSVNTHTFSKLPSLQFLDLSSNYLLEFNRDILNDLKEMVRINLDKNRWKCDCNTKELMTRLSKWSKSKGLDGEQKSLECFEAGVYKTNWTAASNDENCTGESKIISEATPSRYQITNMQTCEYYILQKKTNMQTQISTETPTSLHPKATTNDASTLESLWPVGFEVFLLISLAYMLTNFQRVIAFFRFPSN